jgi:hypothetical protein
MKTLMIGMLSVVIAIIALMLAGAVGRGAEFPEHPLSGDYRRAADELAKALQNKEPKVQGSLLTEAIDRAVACLPSGIVYLRAIAGHEKPNGRRR